MSWSAPELFTGAEISLKRSHLVALWPRKVSADDPRVDVVAEGMVKPPLPQPMPAFALRLGYGQSELLRCVSGAGSSREIDNGCGFRTIDSVLTNRDTLACRV